MREKLKETLLKDGVEALERIKADAMQKAYTAHINMVGRVKRLDVAELLSREVPPASERFNLDVSTSNIILFFEIMLESNKVEYALEERAKQLDKELGIVSAEAGGALDAILA